MTFLPCDTPRCRREDNLVDCTGCGKLVCPECVVQLPNEDLCPRCSPAAPRARISPTVRPGQLELFA